MKFLLSAILFTTCATVSAQENEMFTKAKEHAMSNVDKRIGYLNEMKTCFSSATNKEGMQACRKTHKAQLDALEDSNEAWREGRKSARKARKEAKKK